ncbi:DUF3857 domain-containing protein [Maribacter sp. MAR_2009_72]|uniref:DUF3857 domain-containing protein n=1 Tax=Maribacter sp. MAR_2009_72 TaxID=1250050 RepID=UPI00119BE8C8|nr:DUF3857 domain-containing protein [Maribacter sp. MAR_2009_72]TVZ15301.1 uncharacterized protein DUF3857 [Maribacter sp. MAR_2009_72]
MYKLKFLTLPRLIIGNVFHCTLIFLLNTFLLVAQGNEEFGKITALQKEFTPYENDAEASAVYLYEYGNNHFEIRNDYIWLITKYHAKIKIIDRKGFEYANIEIPLFRSKDKKEKIVKIKALTHNGDRKHYLKKEEYFEEDVNEKWIRTKFTFPNIQEGSIIEYEYEMQSPFFFNFTGWSFQSKIPKLYSEFNAKIPGNWLYNRSLKGELNLDVNEATIEKACFNFPRAQKPSDCESLKYVMKNVPAFKESEEFMLSANNYRSKIEFELSHYKSFYGGVEKYTKSWEDVDKEFKTDNDIGSQLRKKNFFEKNVDEKLLKEGDALTRAKAIYNFVKDHFTWNEEFGIWHDNKVKKAFDEKKGNVAEINIALINLLNAADIKADMMLMATRERGLPKKTHPVMNDFNYIIAKVDIGDDTYLLDATDKYMPFGMLPYRCLNYYGRVMDFDKESYWYDIVAESKNGQLIRTHIDLDPVNEKLSGIYDVTHMGYMKASQDKVLATTEESEYLQDLEEEISDDFHILSHEIKNLDTDDKKLTERFKFEVENSFQGGNIYLNPFVIKFFDKNPFLSSERTYPIDFGFPIKYQYLLNLKIPEGYALKSLPADKNLTLPANSGMLKLSVSDIVNGSLNMFFTFELNSAHYKTDYYTALKKLFSEAVNGQNESFIVLEKF